MLLERDGDVDKNTQVERSWTVELLSFNQWPSMIQEIGRRPRRKTNKNSISSWQERFIFMYAIISWTLSSVTHLWIGTSHSEWTHGPTKTIQNYSHIHVKTHRYRLQMIFTGILDPYKLAVFVTDNPYECSTCMTWLTNPTRHQFLFGHLGGFNWSSG